MPLRATIIAVTTPLLALALSPTPANAALQATYTEVCPTYTHLPRHNKPVYEGSTLLGVVMIGINWGNGRVCVATIKNDQRLRWTMAYVENETDLVVRYDNERYYDMRVSHARIRGRRNARRSMLVTTASTFSE